MHRIRPVVAICGTTGVGTSKLAIELAKALDGEVINADALQVYMGMDIATNKVTAEEMQNVPHHLIDFVSPKDEYSVIDFVRDASAKIEDIRKRNHVPILVGGTHYYIQTLLFKDSSIGQQQVSELHPETRQRLQGILDRKDKQEILSELRAVDPVSANRWHPNDERKILRSLTVYFETGITHSQHLLEQQTRPPETRWPCMVFWLYSPLDQLASRLYARVDDMLDHGLFQELVQMKLLVNQDGLAIDYTRGLFQAIGFKEFDPYFHSEGEPEKFRDKKWTECVEMMKIVTRAYAKRQICWLKQKLIPQCKMSNVPHYVLDATIHTWNQNVLETALAIFESEEQIDPLSLSTLARETLQNIPDKKFSLEIKQAYCDACNISTSANEYEKHLLSRRHKKVVNSTNR